MNVLSGLIMVLLFVTSLLLILLVLVQRGRGGGLAGAFGGLGGQSAFGTKAGDLFTRITIGVAAFWIILCAASVKLLNESGSSVLSRELGGSSSSAPQQPGTTLPASGTTAPASQPVAPASDTTTPATGSAAPASAPAAGATPAATPPADAK